MMRRSGAHRALAAGAVATMLHLLVGVSAATTITIVNVDDAGEGFNDPTPVAPVGGNAGATLGDQRLIAFQFAAGVWETLIDSNVEIFVEANFDPLTCGGGSAVLGAAGPNFVVRDFAGAPLAGTWYAEALGNRLAGMDLVPGANDIGAAFNSSIDSGCLGGVSGWYYGLDGNVPAGQLDLQTTLLHEIAHGLGFLSLVSLSGGTKFQGLDDAYMRFLEDHGTGKRFPDMTNAERAAAHVATGELHWAGDRVVLGSGVLVSGADPSGHVEMYAPSPAQSGSSVSHFSTTLETGAGDSELMEPFLTTNPILDLTVALMGDIGWACGDGAIDAAEGCDDGNVADGDGCDRFCAIETCFTCVGEPSTCMPAVDGAACDDGNECTSEECQGGACIGTPDNEGVPCDDGNVCSGPDACAGGVCDGAVPLASCDAPDLSGKARLVLRDRASDSGDALTWRWIRGTATKAAFGDPAAGTDYVLCVYDAVDGSLMVNEVPAGAGWKERGNGFVYADGSLANDGVRRIVLKEGSGNARVIVKAKGPLLGLTDLGALDLPVTVQLTNGSACWEATFGSPLVSTPELFKARAD